MALFTQYAEERKLETSDIERAETLFAQDFGTENTNPTELLLFLYAKGILAAKSSVVRIAEFKELLAAETTDSGKALERLTTIVVQGETSPTRSNMEAGSMFDDFVSLHPEWKEKDSSFVVFRDHQKLQRKSHALVERFQKSGLCYMHACVVLQHYLVAMNNDEVVPMLDMLKKYMPSNSLYDHIWNNKGGDSLDFLKRILMEKPGFDGIASRYHLDSLRNDDLDDLLKAYGPGLVSGFAVVEDFIVVEEWQHIGKYKAEKFEGRHAMVLVGYRIVDGKKRYLLQNWWKSKPYVEVDIDYLLSSEATIHFIKEKQLRMGNYPTSNKVLVECESGIDAPENFIPEGLQL